MKAHEFDAKFDAGEDLSDDVDWSQAFRPNLKTQRVNGDFTAWVIAALNRRAKELGVIRQSLIKFWIAERLQ